MRGLIHTTPWGLLGLSGLRWEFESVGGKRRKKEETKRGRVGTGLHRGRKKGEERDEVGRKRRTREGGKERELDSVTKGKMR